MPNLLEILRRFRPAGTPGAAAPAGVPADRQAELERELLPVLALLDEVEQEVAHIQQDGRRKAERIRQSGHDRARAIVADAQARTGSVRAAAAAAERAAAITELNSVAEAARQAADQVRERARARMPRFVDQAVALALTAMDAPARQQGR